VRVLYCGDVVGRPGREAVLRHVPVLRRDLGLDFVLANGENAAGGFGITGEICRDLYGSGVDAITTGNHAWDQRDTAGYIESDPKLLRPQNYPRGTPGRGVATFKLADGRAILIVQVMGRLFMDPLDDPFACAEAALAAYRLGGTVSAIIVDIHGEATSEKMAMGHFLDGRVSAVLGTHTHVPTADCQVLPGGTAYISDIGMCGDYDSVIGMEKSVPIRRFTRKMPTERLSVAMGEATLCAVLVEIDDTSGLARAIEPVRVGGRLQQTVPGAAPPA
jgi:metallophosphoesterase (TIGR00282 family)